MTDREHARLVRLSIQNLKSAVADATEAGLTVDVVSHGERQQPVMVGSLEARIKRTEEI